MSRTLRYPDLRSKGVGYGQDYLKDIEQQGRFPKCRRLPNSRFVFWLESEVDAWIDSLAKLPTCSDEVNEHGRVNGGDDESAA